MMGTTPLTVTGHYRLTGSRCRCPRCSELFNSVSVFDRHRLGPWTDQGIHRRCLASAEMIQRGWSVTSDGFWIERKRLDTPRGRGDQPAPAPNLGGRGRGCNSHALP
jgi:hypothetical protein